MASEIKRLFDVLVLLALTKEGDFLSKGERNLSDLSGLHVYLPDGRRLGMVHDAVVEHANLSCTHLFVTETSEELVEGFDSRRCTLAMDSFHWRCCHSSMVP